MLLRIILIAFGAAVIGSLVGGLIGVIIKKPSKNYISLMLGFAAGAMLGASVFELLPESFEYGGIWALLGGVALGVGFVFLVNLLRRGEDSDVVGKVLEDYAVKVCENSPDGQVCKNAVAASDKHKLKKMGVTIFIAMALHSLPEGLAIGAGEFLGIGLLLGIVFFLHFVPEGLAIAVPMRASGTKPWKILLFCAVAGLPAVAGAILAYFIGTTDVVLALCLSFAAGAMIYVSLSDMLPTAYNYSTHYKALGAVVLAGVLLMIVFGALLH